MKNKTILMLECILMLSLVIAGCADNQPQENAIPEGGDTVNVTVIVTVTPTPDPTNTEADVDDIPAASNVTSVTQEELDQLMAGIESLESEDLGGLSSD